MKYPIPDINQRTVGQGPHRVVIVVYDGVKLLDVAGPADVFSEANRLGAHYVVDLVSPTGADVVTSIGIKLAVELAPGDVTAADTLLVAGGDIYPRTPVSRDLADATTELAARSGRVASICTGAFILAAAGQLHGKRATTHWKVVDKLASRYPDIRVEPDAIYTRDGTTYTSAGVSAGIDLALALLEEDHGADLTRDVARALVVYLQRAGGQSQFSVSLAASPPRTPALRHITDMVTADPSGDHSSAELARRLNLSPRHLTRLFREELATTPARYVESIRFDIAKSLLSQGHTATAAASLAGFPSYESLRRVFARELQMSPAVYQRRFRTALRQGAATEDSAFVNSRFPVQSRT
jgi:transcriptional regulator GlxA family with amidase domain